MMYILLWLLAMFDMWATLCWWPDVPEANPLMRWLLEQDPMAFVMGKSCLTGMSLACFYLTRDYLRSRIGLLCAVLLYLAVAFSHLMILL